ncbi:hypothetical protein FLAV_00601 [Flavobacteriales bacterium]|nr:hypothetical protein [Flavobacteriales bacterium]MCL4815430.1 DUF4349 domain-containing protein [Flavobacteriales bacterium]WKZ75049.1 MAG: DUF4349 domain-containing protein [Vicingaceae bacterium]GIK69991.1 MAG: hypothetical protein BroJett020_12860 [Bacteroidota bacterium]CAG0959117.1 hypothetical protein FLAV_00601 [Flavobacteriales bacterium]
MKTHFKILASIVITLIALSSCSSEHSNKAYESYAAQSDLSEPEGKGGEVGIEQQNLIAERKLIKEGSITFETENVQKSKERIFKSLKEVNAYVANENTYTYSDKQEYRMVIRVPAGQFDVLLSNISNIASKIDSKNVDVLDVTEEYIDIEARIKTKKELENRYKEILKQANKVEEILSIEKEIGQLRTEIEAVEGRMRYLKDKIGYSTLTVTFYQKINAAFGFSLKLTQGIKNGWTNLLWFMIGLINIWPFLLLIIVTVYFTRRYIKNKKQKNKL